VRDAQATFLFAQQKCGGLDGDAFSFGSGERPRLFKTVL
jgi:hypothetical protein